MRSFSILSAKTLISEEKQKLKENLKCVNLCDEIQETDFFTPLHYTFCRVFRFRRTVDTNDDCTEQLNFYKKAEARNVFPFIS